MNMYSSTNEGPSSDRMDELVLTQLSLPLFVVEASSGVLVKVNGAAERAFGVDSAKFGLPLSEAVEFHADLTALIGSLLRAQYGAGPVTHDGKTYEAIASPFDDSGRFVCIFFYPRQNGELVNMLGAVRPDSHSSTQTAVDVLNKQLNFERMVRQIISKVYSSLDKDVILQTLVDNLGRALKCQRCLVIIESPQALPVVTHEYAEADISPLGLGRTAKFPASVFERLLEGVVAVPDVTNLRTVKGVMLEDVNDLLDNSVSSMAGVPMMHRGVNYGVIVALQLGRIRKWEVEDLDFLQVCAYHAAISLEHCHSLQRIKDQLFNVNVWSSLTQQLTATLEMASRGSNRQPEKPSRSEPAGEMPALSSRELEVLKLIASGLANKEIANQLFLTESTVELHASRIRKKLKLRSRTALVKYACDHGIV